MKAYEHVRFPSLCSIVSVFVHLLRIEFFFIFADLGLSSPILRHAAFSLDLVFWFQRYLHLEKAFLSSFRNNEDDATSDL